MSRSALLVLALMALATPLLLGRFAHPPPPAFVDNDQRAYLRMASAAPFAGPINQPPFCWRPLLPALVSVTPLPIESGFRLWALLALTLLPPVTATCLAAAGGSTRGAVVSGVLMAIAPAVAGYLSWDYVRTDALALLLTVLSALCVVRRRDALFVLVLVLLSLTKETWAVVGAFALLWPSRRGSKGVVIGVVLAAVVTVAMRVIVQPSEPYTFLARVRELYSPFSTIVVARRIMLASGATWNVLAPIAAFAIGRRIRERSAWAIVAAIAIATIQTAVAIDTQRIVAAAYPFVLLACAWELDRLPPRWLPVLGAAIAAAQLPWLLAYARVTELPLRAIDIGLSVATVAGLVAGLARSRSTLAACPP